MIKQVPAGLVWAVVGLQVALVALTVLLQALNAAASAPLGLDFAIQQLVSALTILAYPAVGVIIYRRRRAHPIGWIFCLVNLGWAFNNLAGVYALYALVTHPGALPGARWAVWLYGWPAMPSTGLLIASALLFPNGRLPGPRWQPVGWVLLGFEAVATVSVAFAPGPLDNSIGFVVDNPFGLSGPLGSTLAVIAGLSYLAIAPWLLLAAGSMAWRFRGASSVERQQIKWMVAALACTSVIVALDVAAQVYYPRRSEMPAWALLLTNLAIVSTVLVPLAVGMAILRNGLYEIDIIIRRTLIYGALTATLALVYWTGVLALQTLLAPIAGPGNDLAIVGTTLLIAALFMPLRRWIQRFIDRRFYRRKYDVAKTLAAFSLTVRDEVDLGALSARLLEVVNETMQPTRAYLWLNAPRGAPAPDKLEERAPAFGGAHYRQSARPRTTSAGTVSAGPIAQDRGR